MEKEDVWMKNLKRKFKKGKLIKYNFLYSNEEEKIGVVYDIKKDNNFGAMITLMTDNKFEFVPYSILEYTIID